MKKKFLIFLFLFCFLILGVFLFYFFFKKEKEIPLSERETFVEEQIFREETYYPQEIFALKDLSLVRERESGEIFWLQNQKKYLVLNENILEKMKEIEGWQEIKTVSFRLLKNFLKGPDFIAPDKRSEGLLIKMKNTDDVFLIKEGKREYLSREEFKSRNFDPKDVIVVSSQIIKFIPPGKSIHHLSLQKAAKEGKIQLIGSGQYFQEGIVFQAGPYEKNTAINIEKGTVLLSKHQTQSLIVTQSFEVFVPKGKKITLEGLWVACIDRFKDWPKKGEILDVTLNVKDWPTKTGQLLYKLVELIDKKGLWKEKFAQEAIWKITDNQDVKGKAERLLKMAGIDPKKDYHFLHLSNPNPPKKTRFFIPPELSLFGQVAAFQKNCPQENGDKIICKEEIKTALKFYLKKEPFPQTLNQKIDAKILNLLLAFYLKKTPIDQILPPISQEEINEIGKELFEELKKEGFSLGEFFVEKIGISPKPIAEQQTLTFFAKGNGIEKIKVKVFDLKNRLLYESPWVFGNLFEWHVKDQKGKTLPNGFYIYQIEVQGFEGQIYQSTKRELIVRL